MLYLFARKFGLHSEFVWTLLEASWSARYTSLELDWGWPACAWSSHKPCRTSSHQSYNALNLKSQMSGLWLMRYHDGIDMTVCCSFWEQDCSTKTLSGLLFWVQLYFSAFFYELKIKIFSPCVENLTAYLVDFGHIKCCSSLKTNLFSLLTLKTC